VRFDYKFKLPKQAPEFKAGPNLKHRFVGFQELKKYRQALEEHLKNI